MNENGLLTEVITAYLQAVDAGHAPDQDAILASYPELTVELRRFFATQDRLNKMAEPLQAEQPSAGRLFGDYEILNELGRGGMGVVYRARQLRLGREVAVKVLLGGSVPAREERLRQEAEVLARLDHPGIVPVYEVGSSEGQAFFVMKLIEGTSLASQRDTFRADLPRAIRLLAAVARAVQYAHEHGIVHRDLKPSNILLDAANAPFVTDFGLALRLDGDDRLTASGAVVGTPAYMAPEQAETVKAVGPSADVWALGVILYELLAGHVPFAGATPLEMLHQVMQAEPPPFGREVRGWARVLEGVCLRCLQRDPARRYASAGQLADDLERWLRNELPQGSVRRSRRLRLSWPGKRALFTALVLGCLGLWVFDRNRRVHDNVERALFALERGEVELARETLQTTWMPRFLLPQQTKEMLDDALALTAGYRADLGNQLELCAVRFSTDGQLMRWWDEVRHQDELKIFRQRWELQERGMKETPPPTSEHTFHYFDTQTGQERFDAIPPETQFTQLENIIQTPSSGTDWNDPSRYFSKFKQPFTGPAEAKDVVAVLSPRDEWWAILSADGHAVHCFRRDGTADLIYGPPWGKTRPLPEGEERPSMVRATYDLHEARWARLVFTMPRPQDHQSAANGDRTELTGTDRFAYEFGVFQGNRSDTWEIRPPPPPEECKLVGKLRLPRYCLHEAQLSLDGKVLITRMRQQAKGGGRGGLWRLP